MSNLTTYPLQDWFETTLAQAWNWAVGTVYLNTAPTFTFPSGVTTYIVVNPWKTTMQVAEIDSYNSSAKTVNVSSISVEKWASVNYSQQTHAVGSKVIISDNYAFWADIVTSVNSKVNTNNSTDILIDKYADATARDAAIPSPVNWNSAYLTSEWYWTDYVGGSWVQRATGATANASDTVAGKVEIATSAESIAGTDTGGTGAFNSVLPSDIAKNIQSSTFVYWADAGWDDTYVVALTPTLSAYTTGQRLRFWVTTANTGACSVDFWPWVKSIKLIDGSDPLDWDILANSIVEVIYDGTNMVLQSVAQRASSAEAIAGTNTVKYMTPVITKASIKDSIGVFSSILSSTSNTADTGDLTAATSWFVTISLEASSWGSAFATATLTYWAASPSTTIGAISVSDIQGGRKQIATFPVKKGYHYRVLTAGTNSTITTNVRFTPNA